MKLEIKKKIWFEYNSQPIFGKGRYNLLKSIQKTNSLKHGAKLMGICEKTAHNYVRKIESRLGEKIISSTKGGKNAGGKTVLTSLGMELIDKWERLEF